MLYELSRVQCNIYVCSTKRIPGRVKNEINEGEKEEKRNKERKKGGRKRAITNSISSLSELSKNEIQKNNQLITKRYLNVFEKHRNYISKILYFKTSIDQQAPCKLHLH